MLQDVSLKSLNWLFKFVFVVGHVLVSNLLNAAQVQQFKTAVQLERFNFLFITTFTSSYITTWHSIQKPSQRFRPIILTAHKTAKQWCESRTTSLSNISNVCYLNLTVCKYLSKLRQKHTIYWTVSDAYTAMIHYSARNAPPTNLIHGSTQSHVPRGETWPCQPAKITPFQWRSWLLRLFCGDNTPGFF